MKNAWPFLLIASVAGFIFYRRTQNVADSVSAEIKSIDLDRKNLTLFAVPLVFTIEISNGSLFGASFRSLTGDVYVNDQNLARVNLLQTIEVKPTSKETVKIPLTLTSASVVKFIYNMVRNSSRKAQIKFIGNLVSPAGSIPVTYNNQLL